MASYQIIEYLSLVTSKALLNKSDFDITALINYIEKSVLRAPNIYRSSWVILNTRLNRSLSFNV